MSGGADEAVLQGARTRTISWEDPAVVAAASRSRSGLEVMRAIAAGELPPPPFAATLGVDLVGVESGRAVFELVPGEFHYNPLGVVHGGIAMTMLDSAMGCAVQSTLEAGQAYTTLQVNVHFVRPLSVATGVVRAEGLAVHVGRKLATAEGRATALETGKLLAHATTTCLVIGEDG